MTLFVAMSLETMSANPNGIERRYESNNLYNVMVNAVMDTCTVTEDTKLWW